MWWKSASSHWTEFCLIPSLMSWTAGLISTHLSGGQLRCVTYFPFDRQERKWVLSCSFSSFSFWNKHLLITLFKESCFLKSLFPSDWTLQDSLQLKTFTLTDSLMWQRHEPCNQSLNQVSPSASIMPSLILMASWDSCRKVAVNKQRA